MYCNNLSRIRHKAGLSQSALAAKINQGREYISRLDRGDRSLGNVSGKILLNIVDVLNAQFHETGSLRKISIEELISNEFEYDGISCLECPHISVCPRFNNSNW